MLAPNWPGTVRSPGSTARSDWGSTSAERAPIASLVGSRWPVCSPGLLDAHGRPRNLTEFQSWPLLYDLGWPSDCSRWLGALVIGRPARCPIRGEVRAVTRRACRSLKGHFGGNQREQRRIPKDGGRTGRRRQGELQEAAQVVREDNPCAGRAGEAKGGCSSSRIPRYPPESTPLEWGARSDAPASCTWRKGSPQPLHEREQGAGSPRR